MLDVARHFCERWNFIKHEKAMKKDKVPFLQPPLGGFNHSQHFEMPREMSPFVHRHRYAHETAGVEGTVRCQVLRSMGEWSLGLETEVNSNNSSTREAHGCLIFIEIHPKCLHRRHL